MKALLIAEKPSLMRNIQSVYNHNRNRIGFDIDFVSQQGHLLGLKMPEEVNPSYKKWDMEQLPLSVPRRYKVLTGRNQSQNIKAIKDAVRSGNYDFIIHAGDPDQEGEILVRETLDYIGNTLPVKRFWVNSQAEEDVLPALLNLEDDSTKDNLATAGLLRRNLDYDYGLNLTRALTVKSGALIQIGRVKAALLRAVCDREEEIENFVPSSTYERAFTYQDYTFVDNSEQFETADALTAAMGTIPTSAEVISCQQKEKKTKAPRLYKLSTLQGDAYTKLGFPLDKTLATLQSLYEKQLTSYPRSGCEYISSHTDIASIYGSVAGLVNSDLTAHNLSPRSFSEVTSDRTYCNDRAIASEGHTGIIPTGKTNGISGLSQDEKNLYALIVRRFVAMCMPVKRSLVTSVIAKDENGYRYECRGTKDIDPSFEYVLNPRYNAKAFNFAPEIHSILNPVTFEPKEIAKKCPSRYTSKTLVDFMDNPKGFKDEDGNAIKYKIGTDATRSNIVNECIKCGYFSMEKGAYVPTAFARAVVKEFGDMDLFNIDTTAKWESMFIDVRDGEANADTIATEMDEALSDMITDLKGREVESLRMYRNGSSGKSALEGASRKTAELYLGNCPCCSNGKIFENSKAYNCNNWNKDPKCGFTIWKNSFGTNITKTDVKKLLAGKTIEKKCTSKAGKSYTAELAFDVNNNKLCFAKDLDLESPER